MLGISADGVNGVSANFYAYLPDVLFIDEFGMTEEQLPDTSAFLGAQISDLDTGTFTVDNSFPVITEGFDVDGDGQDNKIYKVMVTNNSWSKHDIMFGQSSEQDPNDTDSDGLTDSWEQSLVDFDTGDSVISTDDVTASGDFDGDGESNLTEFTNGTDAADATDTTDTANAYDDYFFQIYKEGEQQSGGTVTDTAAGFWYEMAAPTGYTFVSGLMTKPDTSTQALTVLDFQTTLEFEDEDTLLSDVITAYPAGDYKFKAVMTDGSANYNLYLTVTVGAYNSGSFPTYPTFTYPEPDATGVSTTPTFTFTDADWETLEVEIEMTNVEHDFETDNTGSDTSVSVQSSDPLYSGRQYEAMLCQESSTNYLASCNVILFTTEGTAGFTNTLSTGWNMVSTYLNPSDTNTASILSGVTYTGNIWKWDASQNTYAEAASLDSKSGYWIYCSSSGQTYTVNGNGSSDNTLVLLAGWNLVSLDLSQEGVSAEELKAASSNIQAMYNWDASNQQYNTTTGDIAPGQAYWIYMGTGETLTID